MRCPGLTNGSLSSCDAEFKYPRLRDLTGGVVEAERQMPWRSLADLAELSLEEKAVSLVSGVPLKDSAPPLDECGDDGPNKLSRVCAMVS